MPAKDQFANCKHGKWNNCNSNSKIYKDTHMKKMTRALPAVCYLLLCNAHADMNATHTAYLNNLATFLPNFTKNIDQIWPGIPAASTPVVIAFDALRENPENDSLYAFNFSPSNAAWQKKIMNNVPVYVMAHDSLGGHSFIPSFGNYYFKLENKNAILFSPYLISDEDFSIDNGYLAGTFYAYYELTSSPRTKHTFENYQNQTVLHDGFNKAEPLALLITETNALDDYMRNHNEEALKDFAVLAQYRATLLDASSKLYESAFPALPCTYYVAFKAASPNDLMTTMFAENELPSSANANTLDPNSINTQVEYTAALAFNQIAASFALDKVKPTVWKTTVDTTSLNPTDILQAHYSFNANEQADRLKTAKARYHYDGAYALFNPRINAGTQKAAALTKAYQQTAGTETTLQLAKNDAAVPYFKDQGSQFAIDSQNEVFDNLEQLKSFDLKTGFTANNLAVVYQKKVEDFTGFQASYQFKMPQNTSLSFNGTTETIAHFVAKDQTIEVKNLSIASPGKDGFALTTIGKATISSVGGKLKIVL